MARCQKWADLVVSKKTSKKAHCCMWNYLEERDMLFMQGTGPVQQSN